MIPWERSRPWRPFQRVYNAAVNVLIASTTHAFDEAVPDLCRQSHSVATDRVVIQNEYNGVSYALVSSDW